MLKDDVTKEDGLVVINIKENRIRTLKTSNSERSLPVVSESATEAVQTLLELSKGNPNLFPRYVNGGGSRRQGHRIRSASTSRQTTAVRLSIACGTA